MSLPCRASQTETLPPASHPREDRVPGVFGQVEGAKLDGWDRRDDAGHVLIDKRLGFPTFAKGVVERVGNEEVGGIGVSEGAASPCADFLEGELFARKVHARDRVPPAPGCLR